MAHFLLALDQGTTSSRAILFNEDLSPVAEARQAITQHFPHPGWVEHDPVEIFDSIINTGRQALAKAGVSASEVAAIGITNQRETLVLWDRKTGLPVHPAIVWQDRRTTPHCEELTSLGVGSLIREITGLPIDPYFSATKLEWLLSRFSGPDLLAGTIDSWLIWKLTEGRIHATDRTNASRTQLYDLTARDWSAEMLKLFGIEFSLLPSIEPSAGNFGTTTLFGGEIPISGVVGDQQAALFGQACFEPGMAKCTYGTGAFLLVETGASRVDSRAGLITTATALGGFALEGSVFAAGSAVNWLFDEIGLFSSFEEADRTIAHTRDDDAVTVVNAFAGLGAPHWDPEARAVISGLRSSTNKGDLYRGVLMGIAHQCADVFEAAIQDMGSPIREVRVDGGLTRSDALLQAQADLLGVPVRPAAYSETTALGAAALAGLSAQLMKLDQITAAWKSDKVFEPNILENQRDSLRTRWKQAVEKTKALK